MSVVDPAEPSERPTPADRKHDLFQDPALARSLEEDPVASFIVAQWKNILVAVLAIIALFYLRAQVLSTTNVRVAEASETFERARDSLTQLVADQEKKAALDVTPPAAATVEPTIDSEKLSRAAQDSLVALKSGPEPYALMAPLYEELLSEKVSKTTLAESKELVRKASWKEETQIEKRLILELHAMTAARNLLDKDESFKDGFAALMSLAKESSYVQVPAILSLLRMIDLEAAVPAVVVPQSDRESALSIAQQVATQYPEQAEKIQTELQRLKGS